MRSFGRSQTCEIGNEIVRFGNRKLVLVARHQAAAELLVDVLHVRLAEGIKRAGRIADLNGEGILVNANAADLASVAFDDAYGEIFAKAVQENIGAALELHFAGL